MKNICFDLKRGEVGNLADELRATEAGADAFVLKPYGVSDLFAIVQAFVLEDKDRRGQIR